MEFTNARQGMDKIYTAIILDLVAGLLTIFSGLLVWTLIVPIIFGLAAVVLSIISLVKYLQGFSQAKVDNDIFKYGVIVIVCSFIVSLILGIVQSFVSNNVILTAIINSLDDIIDIILAIVICTGISGLFLKKGNEELANKGKNIMITYAVLSVISLIIGIIPSIGATFITGIISVVCALVCAVITLVYYIIYIKYINTARKEL